MISATKKLTLTMKNSVVDLKNYIQFYRTEKELKAFIDAEIEDNVNLLGYAVSKVKESPNSAIYRARFRSKIINNAKEQEKIDSIYKIITKIDKIESAEEREKLEVNLLAWCNYLGGPKGKYLIANAPYNGFSINIIKLFDNILTNKDFSFDENNPFCRDFDNLYDFIKDKQVSPELAQA